jgi:alkylation response protein AidB-like acyl-CoA dehydrogenase
VTSSALETARELADNLLFPRSLETDIAPLVPRELLDTLAEHGLYGLFTPPELGGLGLIREEGQAVIEALASGCLTTTFVWIQHLSTAAVAAAEGPVRNEWARPFATGERRAGIAFSHLRHSSGPTVRATPVRGGFSVDGAAPLVTGWGLIDVVHLAALHGDDIIWLLMDAFEAPSLAVQPLRLAAVNASATVALRVSRHFVPESRVTMVQPLAEWLEKDAAGLRTNGSLAIGVGSRAVSLLEASGVEDRLVTRFRDRLEATRQELDGAAVPELPEARARASLFAVDVTSSLVASGGGRGMMLESHAQLLARWAMFLLVQGQTPPIRAAQLGLLAER